MTSNDMVTNSLYQLETILLRENILDEDILEKLHEQLQQIDNNPKSTSIDEKQKVILILQSFEINLFRQYLIQISSTISSSILKIIFNTIRLQMNINMEINSFINNYYFDLSLKKLSDISIIDYLIHSELRSDNINNIDENFLYLFCRIGSRSMYNKIVKSYSSFVSHRTIPTFFQLNEITERLLHAFIIYLNKYFLNNNFQENQCHSAILIWIINMTDVYGFVPYFIKTNYSENVLKWLTIIEEREKPISMETWYHIINILYNIARHKLGVNILNKFEAISILKQWKNRYINELSSLELIKTDDDIRVAYYLLYAILLEPKQLKEENIYNIETILNRILEQIILAFQSNDLHYGSHNVYEYLYSLSKFVVNDKFLLYIISRDNIFKLFIEKFLEFNHLCISNIKQESIDLNILICTSLYTIFWSISFQLDYRIKLKTIEKFLSFVEYMSKTKSNDEHTITIRIAAKGILFNFDLIQIDNESIENEFENNGINVMISYSHKDKIFCQKILTYLQEHLQGNIWIDFIKLSPPCEDDWEEIAKAISGCDIVIMIVTENYCSSKSCRREMIHADKRNKRIIPVYLGKEYQPEEWFEIRAGSATYVRFGDKKNDEEVMNNLFELVNAQDKVKRRNTEMMTTISNSINEIQIVETLSHSTTSNIDQFQTISSIPIKPIEQLTKEEVEQLLQLPSSVIQLSSGRALLTYIHLLTDENAQFDEYERRMRDRGISREQFANLISSLMTYRSLNNINITSTKSPEQWTYEEIKYWFHQNHLSDYLLDIFAFTNGSELLTYANLLIKSSTRISNEYDRLRTRIETRYNGNNLFCLDEYARLVNAFKNLITRSQLLSSQVKQTSIS